MNKVNIYTRTVLVIFQQQNKVIYANPRCGNSGTGID